MSDEVEQVRVPKMGMFRVATEKEAQELAACLYSTGAWVTVRKAYTPPPNGFEWCVYFKDPYDCSKTS